MFRAIILCLSCALASQAQRKPITIESVTQRAGGGRGGAGGGAVNWAPDGRHFAYMGGSQVMLYDVATKTEKELFSLDPMQKAAIPVPEPQRFDWQNRRVSETSFQWSPSGKALLVSVRGDLFLWHMDSGKWDQLTSTPEAEHDPKLSPDGSHVAFRRGHDLYALDIASRKTTRLTEDGAPTLLNGELDWVYPEELELHTAYWWAPDSS